MEDQGLIQRESVPYDARLKRIIVTEKGQKSKDEVDTNLAELEALLTADIPMDELEIFCQVALKMAQNIR